MSNTIYIPEGQPDTVTLVSQGYPAMTFGSAANMRDISKVFGEFDKEYFQGKNIYLVPDADTTGRDAAKVLVPQLLEHDCKVKVLDIDKREGFSEGLDPTLVKDDGKRCEKDVTDLFKKHEFGEPAKKVFDHLIEITPFEEMLVSSAPEENPDSNGVEDEDEKEPFPTDTQFARDFLDMVIGNSRLVYNEGCFYQWNGYIYYNLTEKALVPMIYSFLQCHEAFEVYPQKKINPSLVASIIGNLKGLINIENKLTPRSFISDPECLGDFFPMKNGIINLEAVLENSKDVLTEITSDFYTLAAAPYDYIPGADCPKWKMFLDEVTPDQSMQKIIQEWFGYCLTSDLRYCKFIILYGEGSNGKSVVLIVLSGFLGSKNVSNVPLENFTDNFKVFTTYGKFANIAPEISYMDKKAEGILKSFVAGEPMLYEKKFKDGFSASPTAKLIFAGNLLPEFHDKSYGIYRRIILLPFETIIPDERQDKTLGDKICEQELPGIFNWALEGLRRLRKQDGFSLAPVAESAKKQYQIENNSALAFLEEYCEEKEEAATYTKQLYSSYKEYCNEMSLKIVPDHKFGRELKRKFKSVIKTTGKEKKYRGLKYSGQYTGQLTD
ncbi:MAG: hypothetical protein HQK83_04690 [Fibrobacteria bacterium]|nr:hypothetical protein [Fibrobacteria bacterium]